MKLTKEMLIDWIDRPPSNEDLDLIAKILNLQIELEVTNEIITMNINRINKLENENQQLKKQKEDVVEYINFLVIFNQNINGKFSDTLWGQEILELLGEINYE